MKTTLMLANILAAVASIAAEKKIVRGMDHFELIYQLQLPMLEQEGTLWIPLARTDSHQKLEALSISSPVPWHKTCDKAHQNELLVLRPGKEIGRAHV